MYSFINQPTICGRIINNPNEVTVNDVPMNGNFAYFPKIDGSEIIAKRWNANGMIDTFIYKAEAIAPKQVSELDLIRERLDKLEKRYENVKPTTDVSADNEQSAIIPKQPDDEQRIEYVP